MPFYEYQCKNCGHELEAMQKISEEPLKKCPHCGKSQLQRLMSAPVFRLKGAGWYETDFKDDKDKKKNLADRPDTDNSSDKEAKAEKVPPPEPAVKAPVKEAETVAKTADKPAKPAERSNKKAKSKGAAKKKASKSRKR